MLKEEYLQHLLKALYEKGPLNVYDYAAENANRESREFAKTKSWCDQLVRHKLASYTDTEDTILQLTNYGIYWVLKGGYETYLKDGKPAKNQRHHHHHDHNGRHNNNHEKLDEREKMLLLKEKEELTEARLKLTHYRLVGFWLALLVSSLGFLLSLYNFYLIMKGKK